MPNVSSQITNGSPVRNLTCSAKACGPLAAAAFEAKCSSKNAPIGMMTLSECNRRKRNECPCPARIGCTPLKLDGLCLRLGGAVAVAIRRQLSLWVQIAGWNLLLSFSIPSFVKKAKCTSVILGQVLPIQFKAIFCDDEVSPAPRKPLLI